MFEKEKIRSLFFDDNELLHLKCYGCYLKRNLTHYLYEHLRQVFRIIIYLISTLFEKHTFYF